MKRRLAGEVIKSCLSSNFALAMFSVQFMYTTVSYKQNCSLWRVQCMLFIFVSNNILFNLYEFLYIIITYFNQV